MQPTGLALDPAIQSIFDSMVSYMGTSYIAMTTTVNFDGQGTREAVIMTQANNNNWQYTQYSQGIRVSITPSTANLGPSQTQQFTAVATNPDGSTVASPSFTWSIISGTGTVSSTGLYTSPVIITAGSSDTVKCSLAGSNSWASVVVTLHP